MAFAAQTESDSNPTGALLLASEAFTRTQTVITRDTLRAALDQPVRSSITLVQLSGNAYRVLTADRRRLTASDSGRRSVVSGRNWSRTSRKLY